MSVDVSQLQAGQGARWAQPMTGASGGRGAPPQQKMSDLFARIDANNTGSISRAQFGQAFNSMNPPNAFREAGENAIWNALDPQNTGQVSKGDFVTTMKTLMVELRQNPSQNGPASMPGPADTAQNGTDGVRSFYL